MYAFPSKVCTEHLKQIANAPICGVHRLRAMQHPHPISPLGTITLAQCSDRTPAMPLRAPGCGLALNLRKSLLCQADICPSKIQPLAT